MVFPDVVSEALLYGRNSRDPKKKGRSVADQLADGHDLCARFDWNIAKEFRDTGLSASRYATRERDDFENLLDAIEAGPASPGVRRIVVAYEASRYYRDLEAYVRLRNACFYADVLLCYNGTVYDLSKREDRRATAMDAINAEDEADGIRDRNVRTARRTAEKGQPWGKIPFGYLRKYDENTGELLGQYEHPVHGPWVLRALKHIDSGGSVNSLLNELKSNKETAFTDGTKWDEQRVRYMLTNRAYLGERIHRGRSIKATWQPIKGLETPEGRALFRRVGKVLADRSAAARRDSRASHLLSLIALCGVCGDDTALKADQIGTADRRRYVYRCKEGRNVTITEEILDAYVEQALMTWLRRKPEARAALIPDEGQERAEVQRAQELLDVYQEELQEARRLSRTRNARGRPLLSLTSLSEKELELLPQMEELEQRLQAATGVPLLVHQLVNAADPEAAWSGSDGTGGLTMEQKREAIRQIVTVRVHKGRSGSGKVPPGRVELSFIGTEGFRAPQTRARGTVRGLGRGLPGRGTQ
ncbi:recombinase family protein [Streptomyces acidicola]|uniref:recombinase family protein n=1 Tax=Streptomyces acidicola TaxID=2596892 RepID=UPI0037B0A0C3